MSCRWELLNSSTYTTRSKHRMPCVRELCKTDLRFGIISQWVADTYQNTIVCLGLFAS